MHRLQIRLVDCFIIATFSCIMLGIGGANSAIWTFSKLAIGRMFSRPRFSLRMLFLLVAFI
jgi:hypothetical protein